ncbi:bifunctional [glutamate--ammonia ligase]-adenylyl-L-tyrosine phosphorylase/[glutamate--ammonia-ligase] adenylyltransferase [Geomonas paludis]|uniref:Bifunctional [glutamate--ammonia ligase]-adenylyl-L-tyrosine phosphorylase/[glutamate--ammonia-ligase] adenylyltransferase n=1 Tax=Geomonas paludis TaxID=2740185 RepID=A0A6V8MZN2_9BACT|nr:bifunctional [glutamate--ammonia ligase]-adenylyl-L-tyrosine phosphorylase/[glutamate--ammonia-ligase] adenylyltransferase [Geomonas paludis]UPU36566.1 bifunctional [glutamate--ammonia ligase]-adenylyl-L-tyrosine phosphorylase/[glutamate--ammonia-ligase] adenylyltransferase [Geomonas paludis]GFO65254.1 glutamate-ammonia-ligase adenylyltransferase [Geomonas paludis]
MSRIADLAALLLSALSEPDKGDLSHQLEQVGFSYGARTVENLRLLSELLPGERLVELALAALGTPLPDMALNGFERISTVVPREILLEICSRRALNIQLMNICGSSPFLTNIICRDPSYLQRLFIEREIMQRRSEDEMLQALRDRIPEGTSYADLFSHLRRFKYAEMLRIAARDLNGLATLEEVTDELSSLAAATLQVAYESAFAQLVQEHGTPMELGPDGPVQAEFTIIGMGKFGGRELNFSSDIDLIYFYSSDKGESTGIPDGRGGFKAKLSLHAFFVKLGEMVSRAISQVTEDGFVFRVDMGLRPDGKAGDLASSMRSAEVYYEAWGQSWERAAMMKARPVAGSIELGERILAALTPFIYRRYLDYNLIEDMMAMKKKIDASLARNQEGEINIKLGRGGIREIEFFIQALQLVYAGKNPQLRERNSLKALQTLHQARIIKEADCTALSDAYRFLRTVEHRIQVVQERQTHALPRKDEELHALARRCGYLRKDGLERFRETLEGHRRAVSAIYGDLFLSRDEKIKEEVLPEVHFFFDHNADPDLIKDMLEERHFEHPDAAYQNLLVLRDGPAKVNLTEQGRRTLEKIAPLFLQEVFHSPDPDLALTNLERFLSSQRTRSSIYALLAENRDILKLLTSMFGMSEFLSKIFIGHPELLDSMTTRGYAYLQKERAAMAKELDDFITQADGLEEQLDAMRSYRHEEFLRIGMNDIYGKMKQPEVAQQLTDLADVTLATACCIATGELARFGRPMVVEEDGTRHEAAFAIVAMGKLGGFELNYHSDLDVIYIYDGQGFTDGEKSITNREYFAKLGQKIILVLTTQTREGYAYKIDTRLRPSGNAGPLVTSLESFQAYHATEAQIWERQALTKARVTYGDARLKEKVEQVIEQTVYGSSADDSVRKEIHRLRMRMENELAKESTGSYNIKTGRGGMVDVEFIIQFLQLKYGCEHREIRSSNSLEALDAMRMLGIVSEPDCQSLAEGYRFLRRLENRLRIIHDYSMNDLGGPLKYLNKLARRLGYDPMLKNPGQALMADYERVTEAVREVYGRILGEENTKGG